MKHIALDDYDLSQATETDGSATDGTSASMYNLFNNRMNVVQVCGGYADDDCSDSNEGWDANNDSNIKFGGGDNGDTGNYTFFFNDGIVFSFQKEAAECTEGDATTGELDVDDECYAVIDVNGVKNPNKVVECDSGTGGGSEACVVSNPTDIYPVVMYDQSILPATEAARIVMYGK